MIVIIGGGISGLSIAYFLHKAGIPYQLLETTSKVGGNIQSKQIGDYFLELGPNSIFCDQDLLLFFDKLSLSQEIIQNKAESKHRYIFKNNFYQKLPSNPIMLLLTRILSFSAKRSIFKEIFNKTKSHENETLGNFFERRFNKEIVDTLLVPFIMGIYAGNPYKLLVKETFPMLLEYEKQYGSLLKGLIKNIKSIQRKQIYSFKKGIQTLPEAMAKGLHVSLNTEVKKIKKIDKSYCLYTSEGNLTTHYIVIAVPAYIAALLMKNLYPKFCQKLEQINYPPLAIVHSVFKKKSIRKPLNGFGALNPLNANLFSMGTIWNSNIFSGKCSEDKVLLTTFVGGTSSKENALINEKEICYKVTEELQKIHNINSHPIFQHFFLWEKSIPQYDENIIPVVEQIPYLEKEGIYICTNWLGGISLPDAIKKAKKLVKKLINKKNY